MVRLLSIFAVALFVASTFAAPPSTYDVEYTIHDDPNDANSAAVFVVTLNLSCADETASSIGWSIDVVNIRHYESAQTYTDWQDLSPTLATLEGLWWVKHADKSNPLLSDFDKPPYLSSLATAVDPADEDLDYEIGTASTSLQGPWALTATLDFEFTLDGDPVPTEEGEDEPVEVDIPTDPPI